MSKDFEPCKCGRPGCNEFVSSAVRGKRKYATQECSDFVRLRRERERKRKESAGKIFNREPRKCECGRDGCPVTFTPKNAQQKYATPECNAYVQAKSTVYRQKVKRAAQITTTPAAPRYREASKDWPTRKAAILAKYGVRRDAPA